jgi:hypothetical protein
VKAAGLEGSFPPHFGGTGRDALRQAQGRLGCVGLSFGQSHFAQHNRREQGVRCGSESSGGRDLLGKCFERVWEMSNLLFVRRAATMCVFSYMKFLIIAGLLH